MAATPATREAVLEEVFTALREDKPTADYEQRIINEFKDFVRLGQFPALGLPFLVKILEKGRLKINPDDVCRLFVDSVPYNGYESVVLLKVVNFRHVSTTALLTMRQVSGANGALLEFPMIVELIRLRDELTQAEKCGGPRVHDFNDAGRCKRCHDGKCIPEGTLWKVHDYGEDGRCLVCGEPRCKIDALHVFNYDGHCHICGKAQPTRCEVVGCQTIGNAPNCSICGKPVNKD
jgi:hypothetical protein